MTRSIPIIHRADISKLRSQCTKTSVSRGWGNLSGYVLGPEMALDVNTSVFA